MRHVRGLLLVVLGRKVIPLLRVSTRFQLCFQVLELEWGSGPLL